MRWDPATRSLTFQMPRWVDLLNGRYRWLVRFVLLFVFVDLLMAFVDLPLSEAMRGLDPDLRLFFRHLTKLGDSKYWLVPLALILPFVLAARQAIEDASSRRMLNWMASALLFAFVAIAASGLFVDVLKIIFGRTRPRLWEEEGLYGFAPFALTDSLYKSFPSGHANTALAVAAVLACFWPRLRYLFLALALPVAVSRVVITAHYLSDVIVGGAIGWYSTFWLRSVFADKGWVFLRQGGRIRVRAPGQLLAARLRIWLADHFHFREGARGRLP